MMMMMMMMRTKCEPGPGQPSSFGTLWLDATNRPECFVSSHEVQVMRCHDSIGCEPTPRFGHAWEANKANN
jgi:hypothetical protein